MTSEPGCLGCYPGSAIYELRDFSVLVLSCSNGKEYKFQMGKSTNLITPDS